MLELHDVTAHYGQSQALFSVSLSVGSGEAVAMLGPNAAGKSTTLKCISRIVKHSGGGITFEGHDIRSWSPQRMVEEGVVQVPEGRQVFPFMSVLENLELGSYSKRSRPHRATSLKDVYDLLPVLRERRQQLAGTLSGGEQQMLAIGRALMARPRLLMLDEPSLGLSPVLVQHVFRTIAHLKETGLTLLIVEQNVAQVLQVVDRAYILDGGSTIKVGSADELTSDPGMRRAYFGLESAAEVAEEEQTAAAGTSSNGPMTHQS
jgi:ABC-type branched-subunit amino acid transport system ATPase component